jgi:hypothetical protein
MYRLVLVLLLCAAACQPVPRPFADDRPLPKSGLLSPPDSAGVLVMPVAGAPAPAAQDLAEAMASALRDAEVPASTEAQNRGSYRLFGTASIVEQPAGNLAITVDWEMRNPAGVTIGRQVATATKPVAVWRQGGPQAVTELASLPAPQLAKLVEGDAPLPIAATDPVIAVHAVEGAPGDGAHALARAMGDALRRANLALAEAPQDKANFILEGRVAMSPPAGGKQQIKISWALKRADGGAVGEVNQENAIPAGSLDGAWGDIAYIVANAAAPGISALIEQVKREKARSQG